MKFKLGVYKVKSDKLEELSGWFSKLMNSRLEEALETMVAEGTLLEGARLFMVAGDYYVAGYQVVDESQTQEKRDFAIDKEHREVLEDCLEKIDSTQLFKLGATFDSKNKLPSLLRADIITGER